MNFYKKIAMTISACCLSLLPTVAFTAPNIDLYGYIRCDVMHSDKIAGQFAGINPASIPLSTQPLLHHDQTVFDARQSRFGLKVTDEVQCVKLKGVIEGDFFTVNAPFNATGAGDSVVTNSRFFRLRHAYAKAELPSGLFLLAGQYWSLAVSETELAILASFVNPFPAVGVSFSRQPQIRLGYKMKTCAMGDFLFEVDAEKHSWYLMDQIYGGTSHAGNVSQGMEQKYPLGAAKVSWSMDDVKLSAALLGTRSDGIVPSPDANLPAYGVISKEGALVHRNVWCAIASGSYTWKDFVFSASLHRSNGLNRLYSSCYSDLDLDVRSPHLRYGKEHGGALAFRWNFYKCGHNKMWLDALYGWSHMKNVNHTEYSLFSANSRSDYKEFTANVNYGFLDSWQATLEYGKYLVKTHTHGVKGDIDAFFLSMTYYFGAP